MNACRPFQVPVGPLVLHAGYMYMGQNEPTLGARRDSYSGWECMHAMHVPVVGAYVGAPTVRVKRFT